MDKAKLGVVFFLIASLVLGGAAYKFYLDYSFANRQVQQLQNQYKQELSRINSEKDRLYSEKQRLESKISQLKDEIQSYKEKLSSIKIEKKGLEAKYEDLLQEKEKLSDKIAELQDELAEKERELKKKTHSIMPAPAIAEHRPKRQETETPEVDDEFWADVIQQKAQLEAKIEHLEDLLRQKEVERKEALQKKLELEIKLSQLDLKNKELERQLAYAKRMISILTRDYVREKENRRAMKQLLDRMEKENQMIKDKILKVTREETDLQKELAKTQEEKDVLQRHIQDMNTIVRDSIEKILTLTDKLKEVKDKSVITKAKSDSVNLAPIVVNKSGESEGSAKSKEIPNGLKGKILNVNEAHNFVVLDIGKKDGVKQGMEFKVYRAGKQIATVKVRMLRDDVSAADIISLNDGDSIKVGDVVVL